MAHNILKLSGGLRVGSFATAPSNPENGLIYYDTTLGALQQYAGSSWQEISSSGVKITANDTTPDYLNGKVEVDVGGNTTDALESSVLNGGNDETLRIRFDASKVSHSALSNLANDDHTIYILVDGTRAFTADQSMGNFKLTNVMDPTADQDAATKNYVDDAISGINTYIKIDGTTAFTGNQSMGSNKLTNLANGTNAGDAVNKSQLDSKINSSDKGAANGVASLDGGGKVPVSQLPSSVMTYEGTFDASSTPATPLLDGDSAADAGMVYLASVAGTYDFGAGGISFAVGDWAIYNGTIWEKSTNSNSVVSVNSQTGVVVLNTSHISENTNLYFTDERAQDAIGAMLQGSATKVQLTYTDGTPELKAEIVTGSLVNADINASAGIDASKLADGSVSNAELQYINSLTSNAQTQINGKLSAVSGDTAPALGGDLALGSYSLKGKLHLSEAATAANFVEEEYIHAITLTASTTAVASALTFAFASFEGCEIKYKIKEATSNKVRIGRLRVVTNGTDISFTDDYTESADCGVSWAIAINGADVELSYTTTANAKTMRAEVTRIKA